MKQSQIHQGLLLTIRIWMLFSLVFSQFGAALPPVLAEGFSEITVTNTADIGPGSLRQAIADIDPGGTIAFDNTLSGATIHLASTLTIDKDLSINGSSLAAQVSISGDINYDGIGDVRIFYIEPGVTVSMIALRVVKGFILEGNGGGIYNAGTLTVTDSTFSGNVVDSNGGVYDTGKGAGIYNRGSLEVVRSIFTENTTDIFGAGILSDLGGTLSVVDSTFSNNSALRGGGILYSNSTGTATILNSTFSNNSATYAGGIYNDSAVTVVNSTFSGNSAIYGGGIQNFGTLTVTNSTFSGNSGVYGGGIINHSGTLYLANTIIANSTSGSDCVNQDPSTGTNLNNLVEDGSCSINGVNFLTGDPEIAPLANNGGPTQTFALLPGSPAIDAGDGATCAADPVNGKDQRGITRPQGAHCDIGAYELIQNSAPVITEGESVSVTMSVNETPTAFSLTLNATDADPGDTLTWDLASPASHGTASAGGTGTSVVVGYTPETNYWGADSFTVLVDDGNGGTDTITVNVTLVVNVGLVVDENGLADDGLNELAYNGLLQAETDFGIVGTTYVPADNTEYEAKLQECVNDGNDLCLAGSWALGDPAANVAAANPGTPFAVIDYDPASPPANLRGVRFDEKEAGYLAGALAGKMTTSNIVGVVGGLPIPAVTDFAEGYRNGAQCANPNVEALINYTYTFTDPTLGAFSAEAMIDHGADVIFGAAGPTGNGAILYSAEQGVWSVGVDTDQYSSLFGNGSVPGADKLLTSAMKNFDVGVYKSIDDYLDGVFSSGTVKYHLAENGVGLAPYHETDASIPPTTKDYVESVEAGILAATIDVNQTCRTAPGFGASFNVWDFNTIHGYGWPLNEVVTLIADDPSTPAFPDYTDEDTSHVPSWGGTGVEFNVSAANLGPGFKVALVGAGVVKIQTLADHKITSVDVDKNTVSGESPDGAQVNVWVHGTNVNRHVTATGGFWSVDFGVVGVPPDELTTVDLLPGMNGNSSVQDEDGDATGAGWNIPDPRFTVQPDHGWIDGSNWRSGNTVFLIVDNNNDPVDGTCYEASQTVDSNGSFSFQEDHNICDFQRGQYVTVNDGVTVKTMRVAEVYFDAVDLGTDIASGRGPAGMSGIVFIQPQGNPNNVSANFTVDPDGTWEADFSGVLDIEIGDLNQAHLRLSDADYDDTLVHLAFPRFTVQPDHGWIQGWDFAPNATIYLTVDENADPDDGTCYTADQPADGSGWFQFNEDRDVCDFHRGQYLTIFDGSLTRTSQIAEVYFDALDVSTDLASGRGPTGQPASVYVRSNTGQTNLDITIGSGGGWEADFSSVLDIQTIQDANIQVFDADGDATMAHFRVPSFSARLSENQVHGYGWQLGSAVTLQIDDPGTPASPDFSDTQTVIVADWDPNETFVPFVLGSFTLAPDQVVTMSSGGVTKTHTVTHLTVTGVDPEADTVSGTAVANSYVEVGHLCGPLGCAIRRINANGDGDWVADFSEPGAGSDPDEQLLFDIQPGTGNEARQPDEDGDTSNVQWNVPNPTFSVRANYDQIEAWEWDLHSILTVKVYASGTETPPATCTASDEITGPAPWGDPRNYLSFDLNGACDIQPGYLVTVSDGTTTKQHIVQGLTFDVMDIDADTVDGLTEANARVDVWACDNDGNCYNRHVTADDDGYWIADWSVEGLEDDEQNTFDLVNGTWVDSSAADDDGDQTMFGRTIPNPRAIVDLTENTVEVNEFLLGEPVSLVVDGPEDSYSATMTAQLADGDPYATFLTFPVRTDGFAFEPEMTVELDDGTNLLSTTLSPLTAVVSASTDIVSGTADPDADLWVDIEGSSVRRHVTADGSGDWVADFSTLGDEDFEQATFDLTEGSQGTAIYYDGSVGQRVSWFAAWTGGTPGQLRIALASGPDLSTASVDMNGWVVRNQLYEPLYHQQADGSLTPAAATGYTVSPDGLTYTVTLRADGRWADNTPVTAQDYVNGLLSLMDPSVAYELSYVFYPIAGMEDYYNGVGLPGDVGLSAPNATTLVITIYQPAPYFPTLLAHPSFLPKHPTASGLIGNGPYQLAEQGQAHLILEPNPYHREAANLAFNEIALVVLPFELERLQAYKTGAVQMVLDANRNWSKFYLNDPAVAADLVSEAQPATHYFGLFVGHLPTDDVNVRKALAAATDRQALIDNVIGAAWGDPASSFIPPNLPGHRDTEVGIPFSPTEAQAYLAAAGYPNGAGFPTIEIVANFGQYQLVEELAQQWETTLGITVNRVYLQNPNPVLSDCRDNPETCPDEAYRMGWFNDYYDAYNFLGDLVLTGSNFTGWSDATYESLLASARTEGDPATRIGYLQDAEDILLTQQSALIPTYYSRRVSLVNPDLNISFGPFVPYFSDWSAFTKELPVNGATAVSIAPSLTWNASDGATGYQYCLDTSDNDLCNSAEGWIDAGTDLSAALSGLSGSTTYYWQVRAANIAGTVYADGGAWMSFTTVGCYTLATSVNPSGSVGVNPAPNCTGGKYISGTVVQLTATPVSGYTFYSWSSGLTGNANPGSVTMNADKSVIANFVALPSAFVKYSPTTGASGVSTSPVLSWQTSSGVISYEYCLDTVDNGSCDTSWVNRGTSQSAGLNGLNGSTTYYWQVRANNADGIVYANGGVWWSFTTVGCYTLSTSVDPSGNVIASPAPNCAGGKYTSGTSVQLTATPAYGYIFSSWSGDASGSISPTSVTMDTDKSVTANFVGAPPAAFVKYSPAIGATGISTSPLLNWGTSTGATRYQYCIDTNDNGNCDTSWVDRGSSQNVVLSGLAANTTYYWQVQAVNTGGTTNANAGTWWSFTTISCYTLTTGVNPSGSVTASPAPNCTSGKYLSGTVVQLTATPAYGYIFSSWSGDASGSTSPTSVTMDADKSVTANFVGAPPAAFVKYSPTIGATGISTSPLLNWGTSTGATRYQYCIDTNDNGSCDTSWVDRGSSQNVVLSGLAANTTYYWQVQAVNAGGTTNANAGTWWSFTTVSCYTLSTSVDPSGNVIASPAPNCTGGKYLSGTVVQLTAIPASGYVFINWSGDLTGSANPAPVTMNADKSVTANFNAPPSSFLKYAPGNGAGNVTINPVLSWQTSNGASSYEYCIDTSNDGACAGDNWISRGTNTSVGLSGLAGSATYYWQARALNPDGTVYANGGTWWSFTTIACYTLTTNGNPSGSVSVSPATNCTGGKYTAGTVVQLSPRPAYGYTFSTWSGGLTGSANPGSVTMDADKSVTANFTTPPTAFIKYNQANGAIGVSTSPLLNWQTSMNATSYEYCLDTSNDTVCDTGWVSRGSLKSVVLSGLTVNTTYYWQVRAVNTAGTVYANGGTWWSFTTAP